MFIHVVKKKDGKVLINFKFDIKILTPILALLKAVSKDKVNLLKLIKDAEKNDKKKIGSVLAGSTGKGRKDGLFVYISK